MESLPRVDSYSKVPQPLLPKEYADAVSAHAKQGIQSSLYPGLNFANLASFLQQPFKSQSIAFRSPSLANIQDQSYTFARQYTYNAGGGAPKFKSFQRPDDFSNPSHLSTQSEKTNSLLFLQGLPSSQWLSTIGGAYRVDPEFFQRHLDFWSTVGRSNYFPLPSLPSTSENMIQLSYISIGVRENPGDKRTQRDIRLMRQDGMKAMSRYTHNLNTSIETGFALGNSIVRDFDVHDETHFVIEQRISIYLSRSGHAPTSLVWVDTGKDLTHGPDGPWKGLPSNRNNKHSVFYPTIQIIPKVALKSHLMSRDTSFPNIASSSSPFAQSSARLISEYGKTLDTKLMAIDPFYALHELFLFCAFSQTQYLNLLESKLASETASQASSEKIEDQSHLLHHQQTLQNHAGRLRENIATIKQRSSLNQPRPTDNLADNTQQQAAKLLLTNYEHLLSQAERLSTQCQAQMALLMNHAMIAESNKAINQAREVTKLTRLAFVFVPLGVTASVCGMNLQPFVSNAHSIWWWFVISTPLLLVSLIVVKWDVVFIWEQVYKKHKESCN